MRALAHGGQPQSPTAQPGSPQPKQPQSIGMLGGHAKPRSITAIGVQQRSGMMLTMVASTATAPRKKTDVTIRLRHGGHKAGLASRQMATRCQREIISTN